jgi:hypothetical protein
LTKGNKTVLFLVGFQHSLTSFLNFVIVHDAKDLSFFSFFFLFFFLFFFYAYIVAVVVVFLICLSLMLHRKKMVAPVSPSSGNVTAATDDVLSSTSSFTHVTGLTGHNAEDLLLSPASSADHSAHPAPKSPAHSVHSPKSGVLTPGSVTSPKSGVSVASGGSGGGGGGLYHWQTPVNGKGGRGHDPDLTPTNIPLPPEEEDELATPKGSTSLHSDESAQVSVIILYCCVVTFMLKRCQLR